MTPRIHRQIRLTLDAHANLTLHNRLLLKAIEDTITAGATAGDIAKFFEVSPAFISDLRKGRRRFGVETLKRALAKDPT